MFLLRALVVGAWVAAGAVALVETIDATYRGCWCRRRHLDALVDARAREAAALAATASFRAAQAGVAQVVVAAAGAAGAPFWFFEGTVIAAAVLVWLASRARRRVREFVNEVS